MTTTPTQNERDPFLWDLAQRVYLSRVHQAREEVSAVEINCDEIDQVMEEALDQSDRGAAILIFSFVETLMHRSLSLHLSGPVKGGVSGLFQPNGPLGTANNRLSLLAALSWIEKDTYDGADLMRRIRNHFAHDVTAKSFEDDPIGGWVTSMPPLEKRFEGIPGLKGVFNRRNGMTNRHLFLARSTFILWRLMIDCSVIPFARKHLVDHRSVRDSSGDWPENLTEASRRFSRIAWLIVHSFSPEYFERSKALIESSPVQKPRVTSPRGKRK